MASSQHVRQYLAYWFQLGKPVVIGPKQTSLLPEPIFQAAGYSLAFEDCWQQIMAHKEQAYLQGTSQTIAHLLQPEWELTDCARCDMPVLVPVTSYREVLCPCNDLPTWPNTEMPAPRSAVNTQDHLSAIQQRLLKANGGDRQQ